MSGGDHSWSELSNIRDVVAAKHRQRFPTACLQDLEDDINGAFALMLSKLNDGSFIWKHVGGAVNFATKAAGHLALKRLERSYKYQSYDEQRAEFSPAADLELCDEAVQAISQANLSPQTWLALHLLSCGISPDNITKFFASYSYRYELRRLGHRLPRSTLLAVYRGQLESPIVSPLQAEELRLETKDLRNEVMLELKRRRLRPEADAAPMDSRLATIADRDLLDICASLTQLIMLANSNETQRRA